VMPAAVSFCGRRPRRRMYGNAIAMSGGDSFGKWEIFCGFKGMIQWKERFSRLTYRQEAGHLNERTFLKYSQ
jgi:hypothetical protein